MIDWPGLELYRVESVWRKWCRFQLALYIRECATKMNADWFGLELPFRYYPYWLERLGAVSGGSYDMWDVELWNL